MAATALLALLLAAVVSAPSLPEAGYEPVDVHLSSNLCTRPHGELFGVLHRTLGLTSPIMEFAGHRFMSTKDAEQGSPPARTIKLHLSGCSDEDDRVTLALSDGDAGVLAFADGAGLWHAFPGFEFMFPNSTTLPYNASYDDLIGGHRNLPAVPLGRASALAAIRALSRPGATTPEAEPEAKAAALARLMVMTTESLRWKPIREAFGGGRGEGESFLTEEAELVAVPRWVDLSYLVWRFEVTKAWEEEGVEAKGLEKIGVHNVAQALSVADLLKRPKELMCKPIPPPGSRDLGEEYGEEDDDEESTVGVEGGDGEGGAAAALYHDLIWLSLDSMDRR